MANIREQKLYLSVWVLIDADKTKVRGGYRESLLEAIKQSRYDILEVDDITKSEEV